MFKIFRHGDKYMISLFGAAFAGAYDAYLRRVHTLAGVFIVLTIIVAIILSLAGKKKACIWCIICGTVFWLFGGYNWLAEFFIH